MLRLETEADVQALIGMQEDLHLEFKAAGALKRTDGGKTEIAKDVSSFANSAGGQIIYGIAETHAPDGRGKADRIDPVDAAQFSGEWLEQVISSNVEPLIEGLQIKRVDLSASGAVLVVTIPQAITRAPHQASDHRYYFRQNYSSVPMEDYQVKDAMRRAYIPDLYVTFSIKMISRRGGPGLDTAQFELSATIHNRSSQPAEYSIVDVFLDSELSTGFVGRRIESGPELHHVGNTFRRLTRRFGPPDDFPLFKEAPTAVLDPLRISFNERKYPSVTFDIGYSIKSPGFVGQDFFELLYQNGRLTLMHGSRLVEESSA